MRIITAKFDSDGSCGHSISVGERISIGSKGEVLCHTCTNAWYGKMKKRESMLKGDFKNSLRRG